MKYLTQNSKIKNTAKKNDIVLYSFGIPAVKTCPNADSCKSGCYATQGAYTFKYSRVARDNRLSDTRSDMFPILMGEDIVKAIKNAKDRKVYIRVHDSGDFYSPRYQLAWYHIARAFPNVIFYAYTKQIAQSIALSSKQPENFQLIYSYGGKQDHAIQDTDRHARVFESVEDLSRAGYINASKDDLLALTENPKVGLVYHGIKSYKNTKWNAA